MQQDAPAGAKQDFARFASLESITSTPQLVKALEAAQIALEQTSQDDARPAELKMLARRLVAPRLAENKAAAVRLWTATCLCEVLRIYAPRAPYGDGTAIPRGSPASRADRRGRGAHARLAARARIERHTIRASSARQAGGASPFGSLPPFH